MSASEPVEPLAGTDQRKNSQDAGKRRESFSSQNSQTAKEFIESQMRLEADAREILPYVSRSPPHRNNKQTSSDAI
jgi:E3 ubiquitin-protein ligase UBR7